MRYLSFYLCLPDRGYWWGRLQPDGAWFLFFYLFSLCVSTASAPVWRTEGGKICIWRFCRWMRNWIIKVPERSQEENFCSAKVKSAQASNFWTARIQYVPSVCLWVCICVYVCLRVVAQEMEDCHGGGVCLEVFVTMAGSLALLPMVKSACVCVCVSKRERDKNRQERKREEIENDSNLQL